MDADIIKEQKHWIKSGKIGCVFASALVKQADKIGWYFVVNDNEKFDLSSYPNTHILSIIFPDSNITKVREWALDNDFFIEDLVLYEGLRYKIDNENVAWVQYFGPDSHVVTRQSPHPMLSFTLKLPTHIYAKTMVKGIYHLAHASIEFLTSKKANKLWEQSFIKTKKLIGHKLTEKQAAKVTFLKW